jgi:hypothetical protein
MTTANSKSCFVIAPIGEANSSTRKQSDQVLRHVIRPAVEPTYRAVRADEIAEPGMITSQIMQRVIEDDLVIADLTDLNPNVLYELAVRHAILKPFVQIMANGQTIPFDVSGIRTVFFDLQDPDSIADAKEEIRRQVETLEKDSSNLQTPISIPLELQRIRQSDDADAPGLREILPVISDIASTATANRSDIQQIREAVGSGRDIFRERREYSPLRQYIHLAMESQNAHGFLVLISYFQGREPWVYEMGLEAYRQAMSGNIEKSRDVFLNLVVLLQEWSSGRRLGLHSTFVAEQLVPLFDRLIDRAQADLYDTRDLPF